MIVEQPHRACAPCDEANLRWFPLARIDAIREIHGRRAAPSTLDFLLGTKPPVIGDGDEVLGTERVDVPVALQVCMRCGRIEFFATERQKLAMEVPNFPVANPTYR